MGCPLGSAREHRQDRPGTVERLDLALLINAEHNGSLGRVEVQPADVVDLLDELRVGRELELLLAVRLQSERLPGTPDRVLGDPQVCRQRPGRPMRRILRGALQRGCHDPLDLFIAHRSRPSRTRLVQQPLKPPLREPVAPLRHRRPRDPLSRGNLQVRSAPRRGQHDPRPQRQRLRRLRPTRPRLQPAPFLVTQLDHNSSRSRHHPPLP